MWKNFEEEAYLYMHQSTTHDMNTFTCEQCGENVVGKQTLKNHRRKHKSDCSKNPTDILTIRKVVKATQKCSISHASISTLSTLEMFNKYSNQFRHVMVLKFVMLFV